MKHRSQKNPNHSKEAGIDSSKRFIDFRGESIKELQAATQKFYTATKDATQICKLLKIQDPELRSIVQFILNAFEGKARKGKEPKNAVIHSLQLFKNADYLKIDDDDVKKIVLLHDVLEDTGRTYEDIKDKFGDDLAHFVDLMTERKEMRKSLGKDGSKVFFVEQLKKGNRAVIVAEILDRMDDLIDIDYLFPKPFEELTEEEKTKVLNTLARKLAKCKFTIDSLVAVLEKPPKDVVDEFYKLLEYRKKEFGITQDVMNEKMEVYICGFPL